MKRHRAFVEQGLLGKLESPFTDVTEQTILGSESFGDQIKREYLVMRGGDRREQTALVHLQSSFALTEIAQIVANHYGAETGQLMQRRSDHREGRRLLMYFVSQLCRDRSTLTDLGTGARSGRERGAVF